jgi:hypothetical protein
VEVCKDYNFKWKFGRWLYEEDGWKIWLDCGILEYGF